MLRSEVRCAGDPVEITVRGYELSVRKADAACVEVVEVRK